MKIPKMSPGLQKKVVIIFILLYSISLILDRHGFYHSPLLDVLSSQYFFWGGIGLIGIFSNFRQEIKNIKSTKKTLFHTRLVVGIVVLSIVGHSFVTGDFSFSDGGSIFVLIIIGTLLIVDLYEIKYESPWNKEGVKRERSWLKDLYWPNWSQPPKLPTLRNHLLIARAGGVIGLAFVFLIMLFIVPSLEIDIKLGFIFIIMFIFLGTTIGMMLFVKWFNWIFDYLSWKFKRDPKD